MTSKSDKKQPLSVKDYEKLGRILQSVFESGYANHWRVYKVNFVRGLFFGLGSVLGGTIIIAVALWILSFFTELPIIGELAETVQSTVEQ